MKRGEFNSVKSIADLSDYLGVLADDFDANGGRWENASAGDVLRSLQILIDGLNISSDVNLQKANMDDDKVDCAVLAQVLFYSTIHR